MALPPRPGSSSGQRPQPQQPQAPQQPQYNQAPAPQYGQQPQAPQQPQYNQAPAPQYGQQPEQGYQQQQYSQQQQPQAYGDQRGYGSNGTPLGEDGEKSPMSKYLIIGGSVVIGLMVAFLGYTMFSGGDEDATPTASGAPTNDAPAEDAPAEDAPAEDAPAEDAPAEDAPADTSDITADEEANFFAGMMMFEVDRFSDEEALSYGVAACTMADEGRGGEEILTSLADMAGIDMGNDEQVDAFMDLSYVAGIGVGSFCPEHEAIFQR